MSSRISGSSVISQVAANLNNSYANVFSNALSSLEEGQTLSGITLKNLMSATSTKSGIYNLLNGSNFSSYLTTNFSALDKNSDGIISTDEMSTYTSGLYRSGVTYEQLVSLSQYGSVSENMQKVLDNFNDIDANHDGKVTQAEIDAYGVDEEIASKKEEFPEFNTERFFSFYN